MSTVETSIPENSADAQYDARVKHLTRIWWVLGNLLRRIVPELRGLSTEEVVNLIDQESVATGVPIEPGRTNAQSARDLNSRALGLNVEDSAPNEGSAQFDFVFGMRLPNLEGMTNVQVLFDIELMRQLSSKYKLADRKQVYAGRSLGSQLERNITDQRYSDAQPTIAIWLCFNRKVNTFTHGYYVEEPVQKSYDSNGVLIQDPGLDAHYSLTHVYTIGFRNDGSQETDNAEHRELFELLAALYSATMSKDEKLRVLNEKFGLQDLKSAEHDLIEEELSNMDALTAAIRDDYDEKLARLRCIIAEKDGLINEQNGVINEMGGVINEMGGVINEKDELLSATNKELSDAYEVIRMLRSELAARDNS